VVGIAKAVNDWTDKNMDLSIETNLVNPLKHVMPQLKLPEMPELTDSDKEILQRELGPMGSAAVTTIQAGTAAYNRAVKPVTEFVGSPEGILTTAAQAIPGVGEAMMAKFAAQGGSQAVKDAPETWKILTDPAKTDQEKYNALAGEGANIAIPLAIAVGSIARGAVEKGSKTAYLEDYAKSQGYEGKSTDELKTWYENKVVEKAKPVEPLVDTTTGKPMTNIEDIPKTEAPAAEAPIAEPVAVETPPAETAFAPITEVVPAPTKLPEGSVFQYLGQSPESIPSGPHWNVLDQEHARGQFTTDDPLVVLDAVDKMTPEETDSHWAPKDGHGTLTPQADLFGKTIAGNEAAIAKLQELKVASDAETAKFDAESSKDLSNEQFEAVVKTQMANAWKSQFYSESLLAANREPSISGGGPTIPVASGASEPPPEFGIAARVSEARAKAGQIENPEPGQGISDEAAVERGRSLLSAGIEPQKVMDNFQRTGKLSADDLAVARAHGEELNKAAAEAGKKFGLTSPEYAAAAKADSDWIKAVKPMQTEWHRMGMTQQGSTDIDTGDFHSLRRAHFDSTGTDFTAEQADTAQKIAKEVKGATDEVDTAKKQTLQQIETEVGKVSTGKPVVHGSVKDIWIRAKSYLDEGDTDYDSIRHKIATDTGLSVERVTELLAAPKGARALTNDMYAKMAKQRQLVAQAKAWLAAQQNPAWLNTARAIPRAFFAAKVFGHGTVGMITHAGINIFDPAAWSTYWPNFFRQYKLIGYHDQGAFHERMMQDLVRDPNFIIAKRAGLANDPVKFVDDYQKVWLGLQFKRLGLGGNRGFDALKLFRQGRFNEIWDALPASMKTPDQAKMIADSVNHATGIVKTSFPQWMSTAFFAPKLEASRWAFMFRDPALAGRIFAEWDKATDAQKRFAMREVRQKATIAGVYLALLAVNQGLLSMLGSRQKVNFNEPRRADFLAFKAAGFKFGIIAPMLGTVRLLANMLQAAVGHRTQLQSLDSRADEMGKIATEYTRGKLSPFASFATDVTSQSDMFGRPLPYSSDKVPARLRRDGIGPYTYGEYAAQQFTPIPMSEAIREIWKKQGMDETMIDHWIKGLTSATFMGTTGARMTEDMRVPSSATADILKERGFL
jgi:hypothetical protein